MYKHSAEVGTQYHMPTATSNVEVQADIHASTVDAGTQTETDVEVHSAKEEIPDENPEVTSVETALTCKERRKQKRALKNSSTVPSL